MKDKRNQAREKDLHPQVRDQVQEEDQEGVRCQNSYRSMARCGSSSPRTASWRLFKFHQQRVNKWNHGYSKLAYTSVLQSLQQGKNSKILLKAAGLKNYKWKYGNMDIWKYGKESGLRSLHSSWYFNAALFLTLPWISEIYRLEKSNCASCYILESLSYQATFSGGQITVAAGAAEVCRRAVPFL